MKKFIIFLVPILLLICASIPSALAAEPAEGETPPGEVGFTPPDSDGPAPAELVDITEDTVPLSFTAPAAAADTTPVSDSGIEFRFTPQNTGSPTEDLCVLLEVKSPKYAFATALFQISFQGHNESLVLDSWLPVEEHQNSTLCEVNKDNGYVGLVLYGTMGGATVNDVGVGGNGNDDDTWYPVLELYFKVENDAVMDAIGTEPDTVNAGINGYLPMSIYVHGVHVLDKVGGSTKAVGVDAGTCQSIEASVATVSLPIGHRHTYLDEHGDTTGEKTTKPPTCADDGLDIFQCTLCPEQLTIVSSAPMRTDRTHQWPAEDTWQTTGTDVTPDDAANCSYRYYEITCTYKLGSQQCGTKKTVFVATQVASGATHGTITHHDATPPSTDLPGGRLEYWQCDTCGLCFKSATATYANLYGTVDDVPQGEVKPAKSAGDVNESGKIDAVDVSLLTRYVAGVSGIRINTTNADVNDSGKVDAVDVSLLTRFVAGVAGIVLK